MSFGGYTPYGGCTPYGGYGNFFDEFVRLKQEGGLPEDWEERPLETGEKRASLHPLKTSSSAAPRGQPYYPPGYKAAK